MNQFSKTLEIIIGRLETPEAIIVLVSKLDPTGFPVSHLCQPQKLRIQLSQLVRGRWR